MDAVEILKAAKAKIENPANWTQGEFARDENGNKLMSGYSEGAVCFCSLGAIEAVIGTDFFDAEKAYMTIDEVMGGSVANYNDNHTHEEVLSAFDKAIKLAEAIN
jgi:hypothetical protein